MQTGEKLAIDDGKPVSTEQFPPWPWFTEEVIEVAGPLLAGRVNYWTGELL